MHNLFQNLNLRKYHLFEQLKLNGRVFRVMTSPSKTHTKLGRKGTRTKHFRYVNCSRRIIIRHVACKRGYFWPFPYLEIKIKQIGGVWMGGCVFELSANTTPTCTESKHLTTIRQRQGTRRHEVLQSSKCISLCVFSRRHNTNTFNLISSSRGA